MKKYISALAILLIISFAACSNQNTSSAPTDHGNRTSSDNVTLLDAGVWPVNEYTEGLPVPPGTVEWAMLDTQHENCSVGLVGVGESDYNAYMTLLLQGGFSIVESVSEEIEGEDYVSIAMILSDGERWLSISRIPDRLSVYISYRA